MGDPHSSPWVPLRSDLDDLGYPSVTSETSKQRYGSSYMSKEVGEDLTNIMCTSVPKTEIGSQMMKIRWCSSLLSKLFDK